MQNSYVHSAGQWHLINNAYAHTAGQWHLVNNAYVHYNGGWHLTKSTGSNLDKTYDSPGTYTYTVPEGVYNIQVQYPTPSGKQSLNVYKVIPGQEIKVNIGQYASTSSIVVSTSTYVLPAFDTLVATINTEIPSQLDVEFSAATPTGTAVSISSTNAEAKDIAAASGAIYNVLYYSTFQDQNFNASINLTPVKSELINWPNARIVRTAWSGRNRVSTTIPLDLKTGNFYTAGFTQNDDNPGLGSAPYSFVFNIQQILKVLITPIAPDLAVSSMSIPTVLNNAIAGVVFNTQFNVIGGQAPFTWTSTPSTYGNGVTLITSGGLFSYTTSSAGTYSFSVKVTDSTGAFVSKSYNLPITGAGGPPTVNQVTLSRSSLPTGYVGALYNQTITATGGSGTYDWVVSSSSLANGLSYSINGATLTVTGTPVTPGGNCSLNFKVTDKVDSTNFANGNIGWSIVTLSSGYYRSKYDSQYQPPAGTQYIYPAYTYAVTAPTTISSFTTAAGIVHQPFTINASLEDIGLTAALDTNSTSTHSLTGLATMWANKATDTPGVDATIASMNSNGWSIGDILYVAPSETYETIRAYFFKNIGWQLYGAASSGLYGELQVGIWSNLAGVTFLRGISFADTESVQGQTLGRPYQAEFPEEAPFTSKTYTMGYRLCKYDAAASAAATNIVYTAFGSTKTITFNKSYDLITITPLAGWFISGNHRESPVVSTGDNGYIFQPDIASNLDNARYPYKVQGDWNNAVKTFPDGGTPSFTSGLPGGGLFCAAHSSITYTYTVWTNDGLTQVGGIRTSTPATCVT
jgi:hypothetical protein